MCRRKTFKNERIAKNEEYFQLFIGCKYIKAIATGTE